MNKVAIAAAALARDRAARRAGLVGSITEARVRERVAAIDASPSAAAELTSFERGWFRSTARIELAADERRASSRTPPARRSASSARCRSSSSSRTGRSQCSTARTSAGPRWSCGPTSRRRVSPSSRRRSAVPYLFEFRGRGTSISAGSSFDADAPPFELPIDEALLTFSGGTLAGTFEAAGFKPMRRSAPSTSRLRRALSRCEGLQASADNELRSEYVMPGRGVVLDRQALDRVSVADRDAACSRPRT